MCEDVGRPWLWSLGCREGLRCQGRGGGLRVSPRQGAWMPADLISAPQALCAENKSEHHTGVRGETSQANLSTALNLLGSIPAWPPGGCEDHGRLHGAGAQILEPPGLGRERGRDKSIRFWGWEGMLSSPELGSRLFFFLSSGNQVTGISSELEAKQKVSCGFSYTRGCCQDKMNKSCRGERLRRGWGVWVEPFLPWT